MDTNSSAYKLKQLPPVYYLNLDEQTDRKEYIEKQFKQWEISNYERVSAYDGRHNTLREIVQDTYPLDMASSEIGCVTSHLKALKHWIETSNSDYAIFCEDDLSLEPVTYWKFDWQEAFSLMPYDFDVIQLAIINPKSVHINIHKRFVNDFSTAAYLITRHHATKLLKLHVRGEKYKLDNGVKPRAVADDLIYNSGNTYSIPLFHYEISLGSSIHPEHVETYHRKSYEGILDFWRKDSVTLSDFKVLFKYDPYLARLPPD